MATPCRVRRKLSFAKHYQRLESAETLKMGESTMSLDTVDKEACKNRLGSTEKFQGTPPAVSKKLNRANGQLALEAPKSTDKSDKVSPTTTPEKEVKKETSKSPEIAMGSKPPSQRMQAFLEKQKAKRLEKEQQDQEAKAKKSDKAAKVPKAKAEPSKKPKKDHESEPKSKATAKAKACTAKKTEQAAETTDTQQPAEAKEPASDSQGSKATTPKVKQDVAVTEESKKKAHAMYMKYWRSINSL